MKDKKQLLDSLNAVIETYNNRRNIRRDLVSFFEERNVSSGKTLSYWTGNQDLDMATDNILFLLSHKLYELTKEPNIKPEDYFSEIEIKDGLKWKGDVDNVQVDFPIIIEDVLEVIPDSQWLTTISIKELRKWYYGIPLVYNFSTQRQAKYKISSEGSIIKCKSTNPRAVMEIQKRLFEHKQIPDTITLNILQDGTDSVKYDRYKQRLIINNGEIDIADGDHRISALLEYLNVEPDSDMLYELRITNYDEQTMCDYIEQLQTVNKIANIRKESLNTVKSSNRCVRRIQSNRSDFGKLISDSIDLVKLGDKLTLFTTINQALDYYYSLNKNKDILNKELNDISDWVSEVLDEVIGLYPDKFFSNRLKTREVSYINSNNIFIGYIALSKNLQDVRNWKQVLKSTLDIIDFSRDNEELKELNLDSLQTKLSNRYLSLIGNYFLQKAGELSVI